MSVIASKPAFVRVEITSEFARVPEAMERLRAYYCECGFSDRRLAQIELAIVESINNCIEHAYYKQPGNRIVLTVSGDESKCLTVVIEDHGVVLPLEGAEILNGGTAELPALDTDIESLPVSGWGMHLVKTLCDGISHRRIGSTNRQTLEFCERFEISHMGREIK